MKACDKTPIFNVFDLVYVGDYRSKVFKITSVRYEKTIDLFFYTIDNAFTKEYGHNCDRLSYREDELTEAIPELAIGDTLENLEITYIAYNDKIHEFEYEVHGEFRTFAKVKELAKSFKPRKGLIVKNGCSKGVILAIDDEHQVYCVLWENGNLSPYVPFNADYITFTSVVHNLYGDTLYSSFFEKAYDNIINKRIN